MLSRPTDASGRYVFESLGRGNYVFSVTIPSTAAPLPPGAAALAPGASVRSDSPATVTMVDGDGRTFVAIAGPVPAADANRITTLYAPAFHGGATVLTRAQPVQVDPDRPRTGIDIVVPRKTAVRVAGVLIILPPRGATDTGAPHRLVVRLLPADTPVSPPRGAASDAQPIATALADDGGAFVFPAVPAGQYVIDAYRPMPPPTVGVSPKGLPVVTPPDRVDGDPLGLWTLHAETRFAAGLGARVRDAAGRRERRTAVAFTGTARVGTWTRDDRGRGPCARGVAPRGSYGAHHAGAADTRRCLDAGHRPARRYVRRSTRCARTAVFPACDGDAAVAPNGRLDLRSRCIRRRGDDYGTCD
jgi:hypothetical protein